MIELKKVRKVYNEGAAAFEALKGIDLNIQDNEMVAIMGASGSGKSTLMNILGCLDTPTSGEYIFDGKLVQDQSDDELSKIRNQRIGFVFQSFHLLPRLTALGNVMVPMRFSEIGEVTPFLKFSYFLFSLVRMIASFWAKIIRFSFSVSWTITCALLEGNFISSILSKTSLAS